jgi:hypothetical protein
LNFGLLSLCADIATISMEVILLSNLETLCKFS